jgi:alpha-1,6-mannosyltransferase
MACAAVLQGSLVLMLLAPPRPGATGRFLAAFAAAFAAYAVAVSSILRSDGPRGERPSPGLLVFIVLSACLFRVTLISAPPALSDDLYRYRWDGRVLLAGGNPYLEPPSSASGGEANPDPLDRLIAHRDVGTIYPPLAQAAFALGVRLSPGLVGIKVVLTCCDLMVIAMLGHLLKKRGEPRRRILIYAWNPLVIAEVAWSGHLEPLGMLLVLVSAAAILENRGGIATMALTAAGLVKVLPLALFAPFGRTIRSRFLALAPLLFAAALWPFRAAGWRLLDGARAYARHWVANDSLFGLVQAGIEWWGPTPGLKGAVAWLRAHLPGSEGLDRLYPYLYPPDLARAVCAAAVLLVALNILRRGLEPLRGASLMTGTLLLLSPTLHPWYLLWMLPWICLMPSPAWILLSGLAVLAYVDLGAPGPAGGPTTWVLLVEYVPFYALLLVPFLTRRRGRGPAWLAPGKPGC